MADEAMRETVRTYRDLSADVENHLVLIKDKTMIQFLAYSLSSPDSEVIQSSLETLHNLIKNDRNKQILRSVFGVTEAIKATSEREDLSETNKEYASSLYDLLITNTPTHQGTPRTVSRRKLATRVTTFQVQGLYPETRQELESLVVRIRGVVSVVLDVESQRCVVRSLQTLTPLEIAEEIAANTAMIPRLVLRNKHNQEFLQNILADDINENEEELPPYLEEGYEPVKDNAVLSFQTIKTNASSWLHAATSFLQNSFYW
ncbi:armadillo repeat-containing protein 1-like [Lycorma delicatula]|uniref:armadillo repeat-containing protein 1-like n=1 Tax=Lycorma delicatula TaxID=130591 RepID=UPI003F50E820